MRRLSSLIFAFVAALSLAGCGGVTADVPPNLTPDQEQEILDGMNASSNSERGQLAEE